MPFFDGLSGLVNYRHWRADHPLMGVVLLHGLRQKSTDYHRFSRLLNRRNIDVWGIDHIGHGLSEGDVDGMPAIDDLAAHTLQLIAIIRSGNPELPLALVGHSLGAGTALIAMQANSTAVKEISAVVLTGTPERVLALGTPAPEVPTLVLHGEDDRRAPIHPIRSWVADRPTITMREFPGAGHDLLHEPVHQEVSESMVDFVLESLAGVPGATPCLAAV
ncbi:alpha/beta hydrolase [Nocardia sp. NPDC057663]|uniref:alpha/beta hydrolase n=1 Tax=Nocardia sp. NPDC057663 TaxID=3346201 RepID=UPI00366B861A